MVDTFGRIGFRADRIARGEKMGKVFCKDCKYYESLNNSKSIIAVKSGENTIAFASALHEGLYGELKIDIKSKSDGIKIMINENDICKVDPGYGYTYIDKIPIYKKPSIVNKNNDCTCYKKLRWLDIEHII